MNQMKPIVGFPGYQVTDDGRVWSDNFWRGSRGRYLRPCTSCNGYKMVCLRKEGKSHVKTVHRLVLEAFVGLCPPGMETCHCDGDKSNNRADNLRWDTKAANQKDRIQHGSSNRGPRNGQSHLTEPDVLRIVEGVRDETLHRILALRFGVTRPTIDKIANGENWGWLTGIRRKR